MTARKKIDHWGLTIMIAGIMTVLSFSFGVLLGAGVVWKNFKKDQAWIKKEIIQLEDERDQVDDLIRTLQNWMEEIERTEGK